MTSRARLEKAASVRRDLEGTIASSEQQYAVQASVLDRFPFVLTQIREAIVRIFPTLQ